uniref:Lysine (K)-specific demethylase 2Bb n=1 Tax=Petromyzon marinus TaxID=7757 RepID=S4RR64_PETMA
GGVSPGPGSASSSSAGPAQGQGSGLRSAISSGARRRRTRCRKCEACVRTECGECTFCKDMKKFGGPGKMKQSCIMRQCIAPILPHTAVCRICGEAGKEEAAEGEEEKFSMTLMECSICNEIVHPACLKIDDKEGVINDELPNCWECPKCNQEGKTGKEEEEDEGRRRDRDEDEEAAAALEVSEAAAESVAAAGAVTPTIPAAGDAAMLSDHSPASPPSPAGSASPKVERIATQGAPKQKKKVAAATRAEEKGSSAHVAMPRNGAPQVSHRLPPRIQLRSNAFSVMLVARPPALRVRPAKPHATSKASSWGLHKPEQNSVGNSSAGRNNANNNSSSSNGNSGDGGAADSTNKNHHAPLVKSEEDGENGNNRTPRLFSSSERLQKAAKSLNGIPRGGPALPRPPSSVSPPKPHLLERHVIKPPLVSPPPDALPLGDGGSHPLRREAWLGVFRFLSHRDLCVCMRVCKTWNRWCCDRRLWAKIDLSRCKSVTPLMLSGIIKRQPSALDLSWSNVSKKQLAWLVNRLPVYARAGLKELVLSGCPWASVSALCGASWPPLRALDLRWAEGVKDAHIRDLLSPDSDYTPGMAGAEDRLRGVSELRLAGLDITDASVALLVRLAAGLATLDLAHCAHLTDQAVNVLTAPGAPTRDTLRHLVLAGCARITDACLPLLVRCPHLSRADLRSCKLVTPEACQRLVTELCPQGTFALPEDRLIQRVT